MVSRKKINQQIVRQDLRLLASTLNELSCKKGSSGLNKIEQAISMVVSAPTLAEKKKRLIFTAQLFNHLAIRYPIPVMVMAGSLPERIAMTRHYFETFHLDRSPEWSTGDILRRIAIFFDGDNWQRIKQCPQCRKWFTDYSRNKGKQRCSKSCTNRWWSRDRRKQEGHGKGKRRRMRKEG